jgi:S1-C subfamily serine protease
LRTSGSVVRWLSSTGRSTPSNSKSFTRYIQTTAPISPGSSGGGLLDARGNLIGITTAVLVGKKQINQSLNFAIAADSFWQP